MVQVKTNAKSVAEAFREMREQFPSEFGKVLGGVGMSMRKDIKKSIEGKGPISVAPINKMTLAIRRHRGNRKRGLGEKLSKTIGYNRNGNKSVTAGTAAGKLGEFYQTSEHREFTKFEKRLVALATNPKLKGETNPYRIQWYADKITERYNRPARPIFHPYSKWPGLANRIIDSGTKMLQRMTEKAARKAAQAPA